MKKIGVLFKWLVFLFLFIFFFFYAIVFNSAIGWDLLFLFILLVVVTAVSLIFPLRNIDINDYQAMVVQMDEPCKIRLELQNVFTFFPVLLLKCDELNLEQSLTLFHKKRHVIESDWTPTKRGIIKELTVELESHDFFGLFSRRKIKKVPAELFVLPKRFNLSVEMLDLLDPTLQKTIFGQPSFELDKIREYQPGDSVKGIDWKLSSKRQQLIYREYQNHEKDNVLFLFYGTRSPHFEEMLSLFFSFYQRNSVESHRFVLVGEGIETKNHIDLFDFCQIKNNENLIDFPQFNEKQAIFFVPEPSANFENNINELPTNRLIRVFDYKTLKSRLML